jgi:hypothetical protein
MRTSPRTLHYTTLRSQGIGGEGFVFFTYFSKEWAYIIPLALLRSYHLRSFLFSKIHPFMGYQVSSKLLLKLSLNALSRTKNYGYAIIFFPFGVTRLVSDMQFLFRQRFLHVSIQQCAWTWSSTIKHRLEQIKLSVSSLDRCGQRSRSLSAWSIP